MRLSPETLRMLAAALRDAMPVADLHGRVNTFVPMSFPSRNALTRPVAMPDGTMVREFSDANARFIPEGLERLKSIWRRGEHETMPLGELLDHPALYADFPWMQKTRIGGAANDNLGQVSPGLLSSRRDRIDLDFSRQNRSDDDILGTLIHEINHIVQHSTGLPKGGQPPLRDQFYYGGHYPAWQRILGEQGAVQAQERRAMPLAQLDAQQPNFFPDYINLGREKYLLEAIIDELRTNRKWPGQLIRIAAGLGATGVAAGLARHMLYRDDQ